MSSVFPSGLTLAGMKVVAADDQPFILDMIRATLEAAGAEVHTIESAIGLSGLLYKVARSGGPNAVILDVNMPAIPGTEAVSVVRSVCPGAAILFFSADPKCGEYAAARGVPWLAKTERHQLVDAVRSAIRASKR